MHALIHSQGGALMEGSLYYCYCY